MLRVSAEIAVHSPEAFFEIQYGTIKRPTHFNTSWNAAKFEAAAQRFADISQPDYGFSIINNCKYGHYIHENIVDLNLLFRIAGLELDILWPDPDSCMQKNENNASIVIGLEYATGRVLLMGDAEKEVESHIFYVAEILKSGHHCSETSSTKAFLESIDPKIAICSVGVENKFGHPSDSVIERFDQMGIEYKRTDVDGSIVVDMD